MIKVSEKLLFSLSNSRISYMFRVSAEGLLEHIHFGRHMPADDDLPGVPRRVHRSATLNFQGIRNLNLNDTPQEYSTFGNSDMHHPTFHALNPDGNTTNVLLYEGHEIVGDKPELPNLPSARGGDSETLIVTLMDKLSQLRVELIYTIYRDHDVIARSANICNDGDKTVRLLNVSSSQLDLPSAEYEVLHLRGSWGREYAVQRMPVPAGAFVIDSASGASSNHHNPFIAVAASGVSEFHGDVFGMALVYSGSFSMRVEKSEFDAVRVLAGINPFNFSWRLEAGETFACPEALHVFSTDGLNGMSQIWHTFIREQLCPLPFRNKPRPTYCNTWEAFYLDVNEKNVLQLADQAKSLGLEMLVLDDGWFVGRHDTQSGLGDWRADPGKFPDGISELARKVKEKGLQFGLWLEPEMVSEQSELYREHREWVIQTPNRPLSKGRDQLILDLSQQVVIDHLFDTIDELLACGHIDYIKWDMNRVMSETGSTALRKERQQETSHRYMLGLYRLLGRLVRKYPRVLFENCASGGNRFDLGMLNYMSQGWISDMSEPVGRLDIMHGFSHLFPPCVSAAYIPPLPSHQNGRASSLKLCAETSFFCAARGLSLDGEKMEADREELSAAIAHYKKTAEIPASGQFYRLRKTANEVIWQLVSADRKTVYLGYFHILCTPNEPLDRVKLVGLKPDAYYRYHPDARRPDVGRLSFSGESLMHLGVDLPYASAIQPDEDIDYLEPGDFASRLMMFQA